MVPGRASQTIASPHSHPSVAVGVTHTFLSTLSSYLCWICYSTAHRTGCRLLPANHHDTDVVNQSLQHLWEMLLHTESLPLRRSFSMQNIVLAGARQPSTSSRPLSGDLFSGRVLLPEERALQRITLHSNLLRGFVNEPCKDPALLGKIAECMGWKRPELFREPWGDRSEVKCSTAEQLQPQNSRPRGRDGASEPGPMLDHLAQDLPHSVKLLQHNLARQD